MEPGSVLVWPGEMLVTAHGAIHVRRAPGTPGTPGTAGTAEPLLLVHGLGGSSLNWTYLMAELGPSFDSVALDLPGFGWSAPPEDADLTLDGHVRAVVDTIETLGVGPVHLAGNSLGGALATRVASQRGDLVRTLTLVSPALPNFPPSRATLEMSLVVLVPRIGPAVLHHLWRLPVEERIRRTQELCFGDCTRVDPLLVEAAVEDLRAREGLTYAQWAFTETLRSLVAAYLDRGPRALWRQAARVTCPVLVVVGGRDRLVNRRVARKALRVFPDSHVVFMPAAGHVAHVEYPRAVATAMRDLVTAHAAPGSIGNDLAPWDA